MHLFNPSNKAYFTSGLTTSSGDDNLYLKDPNQKIDNFQANINLATRDLGYGLLGIDGANNINNNDIKSTVEKAKESPQTIFHKIKYNKPLSKDDLNKKVLCQTITAIHNNRNDVFSTQKTINLNLDKEKIAQWQKNFKVYFSGNLNDQQKSDIIKSKLSLKTNNIHHDGHNMTFMVESQCYLDSRDNVLDQPLPIKILGFCYPDFRLTRKTDSNNRPLASGECYETKFWKQTKTEDNKFTNELNTEILKKELTEVFRINLLAVIAEAQKVNQSLPFFINIPGAFLAGLDDIKKNQIKTLIAESFVDLKKQYSSLIKKNISEFIVLGSSKIWGDQPANKFKEDQNYHTTTHIVDADMLDIVEKLHINKGLVCPVPMMANPSHPIGCQYLDKNFLLTAFDEMLARRTGGLHRAIFEGGVIKQVQISTTESQTYLRSIDDDPVFKTFTKVQFNSLDIGEGKKIFCDPRDLNQDATNPNSASSRGANPSLEVNANPHSFKVIAKSVYEDNESIDVAPIFSTAVKNAVKNLQFLKDFESDPKQAEILFNIMVFANQKQGVGNKIEDLKKYFIENYNEIFTNGEDQSNKQTNINIIAQSAKTFSYNFQKEMKEIHGFETGRINAKNPNVGARFHRMASKENIMQFFANTKFSEKLLQENNNLQAKFLNAEASLTPTLLPKKINVTDPAAGVFGPKRSFGGRISANRTKSVQHSI